MKKVLVVTILMVSISLSIFAQKDDAKEASSNVIYLPKPTGKYAVGTVTYNWTDDSRTEITIQDTKDKREIIAQIWYPAVRDEKLPRSPYFSSLDTVLSWLRTKSKENNDSFSKQTTMLERLSSVKTNSFLTAKLPKQKFPVLIFSPGGNMSRHFYTVLMEEMASRGFVVASISHKHSGLDFFPNEGLVTSSSRWVRPAELKTKVEKDRFWEPLADTQAKDAVFVFNQMINLNKYDSNNLFTNRLDTKQVAILGHSRGVKTVARTLAIDKRFKGGIMFDNLPAWNSPKTEPHQPVMMIRPADWDEESVSDLQTFFNSRNTDGFDVTIEGSVHMNFSDFPIVYPEQAKSKIENQKAYQITYDYIFAFLGKYLKGKDSLLLNKKSQGYKEVEVNFYTSESNRRGKQSKELILKK